MFIQDSIAIIINFYHLPMQNKEEFAVKKKKQRNLLYISAGVLAVLLSVALILVTTGVISKDFFYHSDDGNSKVEKTELKPFELEEEDSEPVLVETEQGLMFEKKTELSFEDELEGKDMILSSFPSEIPLPGGFVLSSQETVLDVSVVIEVNSTAGELFDWYISKFVEKGWIIENQIVQAENETWFSSSIEYRSVQEGEITEGYEPIRGIVSIERTSQQQSPVVTVSSFFN